ncbi:glutaredoxin family protein [Aeribacillus pallidus]|jgi:glutaredoxin-like YruB-family protein|uniref:glutaredoxin family protein n=1 Tax=Aeribacillus pallidus TaxID=33936 RepID=UPI001E102535|nr:glutathione S-transferase N-terminal domain-containing protein [Bacillus sp. (in: firmicutes)]
MEVIVYSQPDCPPCSVVKMFLKEANIPFTEKNIKEDSRARNELIKKYKSFSTPTTIVDDEVIIGFDLEKLKKALKMETE